MFNKDKQQEATKNLFMSSVRGFANVIAFAVSFLVTPDLHGATMGWIGRFTLQSYGPDWVEPVWYVWWAVCALTLFFLTRATISTLIVTGGLALATRFI